MLFLLKSILIVVYCFGNTFCSFCDNGEAIVCRNYFTAKNCNLTIPCMDIWMHTDLKSSVTTERQCISCEHFLRASDFDSLSLLVTTFKNNISSDDLKYTHLKLLNKQLLCSLLINKCQQTLILPSLRFKKINCEECVTTFNSLNFAIYNSKTEKIGKSLLTSSMCSNVPFYFLNLCKQTVIRFSDSIFKMINVGTSPKMNCALFGLCLTDNNNSLNKQINNKNDQESLWKYQANTKDFELKNSHCEFCTQVFGDIKKNYKNNQFTNMLMPIIEKKFCSQLDVFKPDCINAVSIHLANLIHSLSNADFKILCSYLNQCPKQLPPKFDNLLRQLNLEIKFPYSCDVCMRFTNLISDKIIENVSVETMLSLIKSVCNLLPPKQAAAAIAVIDEYAPIIISALMDKRMPEIICSYFKFCKIDDKPESKSVSINGNITCELCKFFASKIQDNILSNSNIEEIEAKLDVICAIYPFSILEKECMKFIHSNTAALVRFILSKESPEDICKHLGECPTINRQVRIINCMKLKSRESQCKDEYVAELCGFTSICESSFKDTKRMKTPNCQSCRRILAKILTQGRFAVDCSLFVKPSEQKRCTRIKNHPLKEQIPSFGELNTFCQTNYWCDFDEKEATFKLPKDAQRTSLIDCDSPVNVLCTSTLYSVCGDYVKQKCNDYLLSDKQKDIEKDTISSQNAALKALVCRAPSANICNDKKIVNLCNFHTYCEAMGYVQPSVPPIPKACARGPAYSCQSIQNAKQCNTFDMCKQFVWR